MGEDSHGSITTARGQHRAAKRALDIIELVASSKDPISLSEVCRRANLPKSSAHSLLHTLAVENYLERDAHNRYTLGSRLLQLLGQLPRQFELPRVARPIMQQAVDELGETSLLGIRRGTEIIYIDQVEAPQFIRYVAPVGEPRPIYCTSMGKLFLSEMPVADARALLELVDRTARSDYTKVDIGEILTELDAIRSQGYALNREESIPGVIAVGAPIREGGAPDGRLVAGVSLVGPADRMGPKLRDARERVVAAAEAIGLGVKSG